MRIRRYAANVALVVLVLGAGCSDKGTGGTGTVVADVTALAAAYSQLADALNGRDTAALFTVVDTGYYDRGVTADSLRRTVNVYFDAYDSIDAAFPHDSLKADVYGSMARVRHTLSAVSRTVSGDTLVEFTTGTMDWILRDGGWLLYGNQADSLELVDPVLPDTAETGMLRALATHYGAALGVPLRIAAELGWYRSGAGTAYTDVAFVPAVFDTSDSSDIDSLVVGADSAAVCYGTLFDSVVAGMFSFSGTQGGLDVSCTGGTVAGTDDSLVLSCMVTVAGSVRVTFDGQVRYAAGATHADDAVYFMSEVDQVRNITGSWPLNTVNVVSDTAAAGSSSVTIGQIAYPYAAAYPGADTLWSRAISGDDWGDLAYADTIDGWYRRWVDPVSGTLRDEAVQEYFSGSGAHRSGVDGISGLLTTVVGRLPTLDTGFRNDDDFRVEIVYGAGTAVAKLFPVAGGAAVAQDTVTLP